jgi:hypothetical protein
MAMQGGIIAGGAIAALILAIGIIKILPDVDSL